LPFIKGEATPSAVYLQKYERLLDKWQKVLKDHEDATPKDDSVTKETETATTKPELSIWETVLQALLETSKKISDNKTE